MEDQGVRFGNTQNPSPEKLMTVADVAAILNRSRRYVHDHAREMGALRIGGGPPACRSTALPSRRGPPIHLPALIRSRSWIDSREQMRREAREMPPKKKVPREMKPAPPCRCECKACDVGIHCGNKKSGCEHPTYRTTPRTH